MIPDRPEVQIVADEARKTFNNIKKLNKESPKFTRQQREELQKAIQKEKDIWWETVKGHMKKERI